MKKQRRKSPTLRTGRYLRIKSPLASAFLPNLNKKDIKLEKKDEYYLIIRGNIFFLSAHL